MTVIAWDGKTLAADKRMGTEYPSSVTKLRRSKRGELIGWCGDHIKALCLFDWWEDGANPATFPEWNRDLQTCAEFIIIRPDRTIWVLQNLPKAMQLETTRRAMGSGRDYAAAAMHLGHTARTAVQVACELCASCGNGIDTLEFEP